MSKQKERLSFDVAFPQASDNLCSNLWFLLDQTGMSQSKLAEIVGTSHKYIGDIISGRSAPSLVKLMAIAKEFGVTPDALLYHNIQKEYESISYEKNVADKLLRPIEIPECSLQRYRQRSCYMYYYTICDNTPQLCQAQIVTQNDIKMHYIVASLITPNHTHSIKIVIDYPNYVYLFGINNQNPTRFFIMFSDPVYFSNDNSFPGSLAICVSTIPEGKDGLPGMQFVALSTIKLDINKHKRELCEFLTVPERKRILRLHPEQNDKYVRWLKDQSSF